MLHGDDFCSVEGNMTLIGRIASLHVVYQLNKARVLWFGQLVKLNPGAMVNLRNDEVRNKSEMVYDFCVTSFAAICPPKQSLPHVILYKYFSSSF